MKKVWVVIDGPEYETSTIVGIFDTEEKAEKYKKEYTNKMLYKHDVYIDEFEVQ